jgi:hypothetical protein
MVFHTISLACELGIVTATLLSLFSTLHGEDGRGNSDVQRQVMMTMVSLATTILAFCLSLVGVANLWRATQKALSRVRATSFPFRRTETGAPDDSTAGASKKSGRSRASLSLEAPRQAATFESSADNAK